MLRGPADAYGDVQLGLDRFARLAHLAVGWQPASVNHRPGASQDTPRDLGQLLHDFQVLLLFDAPANSHDDLGLGDVHVTYGCLDVLDELFASGLLGQRRIYGHDLSAQRLQFFDRKGSLSHGGHILLALSKRDVGL